MSTKKSAKKPAKAANPRNDSPLAGFAEHLPPSLAPPKKRIHVSLRDDVVGLIDEITACFDNPISRAALVTAMVHAHHKELMPERYT